MKCSFRRRRKRNEMDFAPTRRAAWADTVNRCLECSGHEERINHRSHAERGLDRQPTIHEGVVARALEKKGIISDRCELNRQIKADNTLLRELKSLVKKLMNTVKKHDLGSG